MGEYYFKREQFYEKAEQMSGKDQQTEAASMAQEKKSADDEQLFFGRDKFYKRTDQLSEESNTSSQTTPAVQTLKSDQQIKDGQIFAGSGFSLTLPKNWPGMANYMLLGPEMEGEQPSIQISVEENIKAKSAAEYARQRIAVLEEHLPGCQILHQGEAALANGQKGYQIEFSWSPEDNQQLYQQQIFVVSGSNGYNLTAIFTEKTYKAMSQEVTSILMSFYTEN